ncbi:hypothetical protein OPV22_025355 [Ensete ventricosum]|uniref:PGG domain-containing protein n=1 Tax=Ensete ventricosum TaxID=4639 RepID=A0AAV8QFC5_ENSVE|nr:hypothetical protein OPV22_025355 [Ensete ventricosum]
MDKSSTVCSGDPPYTRPAWQLVLPAIVCVGVYATIPARADLHPAHPLHLPLLLLIWLDVLTSLGLVSAAVATPRGERIKEKTAAIAVSLLLLVLALRVALLLPAASSACFYGLFLLLGIGCGVLYVMRARKMEDYDLRAGAPDSGAQQTISDKSQITLQAIQPLYTTTSCDLHPSLSTSLYHDY